MFFLSELTRVCVFFFSLQFVYELKLPFTIQVYKLTVVREEEALLGRHRLTDVCVQL